MATPYATGGCLQTDAGSFLVTQSNGLLSTYNIASLLPALGESMKVPQQAVSGTLQTATLQAFPKQVTTVEI